MGCLDPPLEEIPEEDFYCPDCRIDKSEIIGKNERVRYGNVRANMPSRKNEVKRDWGKGINNFIKYIHTLAQIILYCLHFFCISR